MLTFFSAHSDPPHFFLVPKPNIWAFPVAFCKVLLVSPLFCSVFWAPFNIFFEILIIIFHFHLHPLIMCLCEPLGWTGLDGCWLVVGCFAYSLIWYNNGSSFIVLFLWIQCFEYLIELTRLTHTSSVDGQSGLLWLYNVQANISKSNANVRTHIYIVRIRIKIIHARHTRAFLSLFSSRVDRAREISSLNSSWMRKNSQLSTLRMPHLYVITWKYMYISYRQL